MTYSSAFHIAHALKELYDKDTERYWTASEIETQLKHTLMVSKNNCVTSREIASIIRCGCCDKYARIEILPCRTSRYSRLYKYIGDVS